MFGLDLDESVWKKTSGHLLVAVQAKMNVWTLSNISYYI